MPCHTWRCLDARLKGRFVASSRLSVIIRRDLPAVFTFSFVFSRCTRAFNIGVYLIGARRQGSR
jgi:hypothetical protein